MKESKKQFSIVVEGTKGVCAMGELVGNQYRVYLLRAPE